LYARSEGVATAPMLFASAVPRASSPRRMLTLTRFSTKAIDVPIRTSTRSAVEIEKLCSSVRP
jgi:hypothetical protein